jgi:hypothetical protein
MTHVLLLFAIEVHLNGWPAIGFRDNLERPSRDTK